MSVQVDNTQVSEGFEPGDPSCDPGWDRGRDRGWELNWESDFGGPDHGWTHTDADVPFDPYDLPVQADPLDRAVTAMREADRAMATVLRAVADASPRDGLSVRRHLGLQASATGVDVGFLDRAVQVLSAMPRVWTAFDEGSLSWSQLRGIVLEARRLTVAQRRILDEALAGLLASGLGEPDRIVATTADLAARLDREGLEKNEDAQERSQRLVLQPGFDGWTEIHGTLAPEVGAMVGEALDAAADPPVSPGDPQPVDADGKVIPKSVRPVLSRAQQWAEALGRIAATYLGGHNDQPDADGGCGLARRARPRVMLIARLTDLLPTDPYADDDADGGVGSIVSRLLLRRGSGQMRISRALVRSIADDADLIPVFTDDADMPVAIGDSYSPITPALRRAVIARDQGCRAPGCSAPAAHCDVHHVIPREDGGPTEITNTALICRGDHTQVTRGRWRMRMDPDGTLYTTIGRHTYTTRPGLNAPPPLGRPPPARPPPGRPPPGRPPGEQSADERRLPF
ncbi:MAG: DUF222 domain-containing protein [Euzebya sp.]